MKPPVFSCLAARTTDNGSFYGRFLFGPLPVDISLTLATILRRSLLHNKAPFVIISAEIEGATHEYAALPGIQESVLEILLNLGEIVLTSKKSNLLNPTFRSSHFNQNLSNAKAYVASLRISGPCVVTAKDVYWPDGIYCVKPNAHIATLSTNNTLGIRIKIISTATSQTYPCEKPHFGLFSKHLRSLSTLSFASCNVLKGKQSSRLEGGIKRNFGLQSLKIGTTFGFSGVQLKAPFLKTTGVLFNKSIRKRLPTLIKKPSVNFLSKHPAVLAPKVVDQGRSVSSSRSWHYPFLDFNIISRNVKSTVPGLLGIQNTNSVKGPIKEVNVFEKEVSKNFFYRRRKQLSGVFSSQQNSAFSLSFILQYLSRSLKKQAIKHLSFTELFENRFSKIKKSKQEPKSIEPWGNELAVASSFYPVEKVNFVIERDDQLVGHRHRIIFEVWTNGSISPRQAIFNSINWVMKLLYSFREPIVPFEDNL